MRPGRVPPVPPDRQRSIGASPWSRQSRVRWGRPQNQCRTHPKSASWQPPRSGSRADNLIRARDTFRAVGECRNGLRAAQTENLSDAQKVGSGDHCRGGSGGSDDDFPNAGLLRRNHAHEDRGGQGKTPAGHVAGDALQRPDDLSHFHSGARSVHPSARQLAARRGSDISGSLPHRRHEIFSHFPASFLDFLRAHHESLATQVHAVEFLRQANQGAIAAAPYIFQNAPRGSLGEGLLGAPGFKQPGESLRIAASENWNHHITILLRGYSTIPCALAAFRRGMISRTVFSSITVFTATQSDSLSSLMVGFLRAGNT